MQLTCFSPTFLYDSQDTITNVKDNRKPRPLYDVPYMFEAREFLRKKLIGKKVRHSWKNAFSQFLGSYLQRICKRNVLKNKTRNEANKQTKQRKKVDVHVTQKFQLALLFCLFLFAQSAFGKDKTASYKPCNVAHSLTALYLPCVGECKS